MDLSKIDDFSELKNTLLASIGYLNTYFLVYVFPFFE